MFNKVILSKLLETDLRLDRIFCVRWPYIWRACAYSQYVLKFQDNAPNRWVGRRTEGSQCFTYQFFLESVWMRENNQAPLRSRQERQGIKSRLQNLEELINMRRSASNCLFLCCAAICAVLSAFFKKDLEWNSLNCGHFPDGCATSAQVHAWSFIKLLNQKLKTICSELIRRRHKQSVEGKVE